MAGSIEKLESEITCSLCLLVFQEPRKLPCDHVYCTGCLERLAQTNKSFTIECPECRKTTQIPDRQVDRFPVAFRINRLKDVYVEITRTLRTTLTQSTECPGSPSSNACKEHKTETMVMYCETCKQQICRDCVLASNTHKEHTYGYTAQIAERIRRELGELTEPLKKLELKSSVALKNVKEKQTEIKSQGELLQESIDIAFAEIISKLKEEKAALEKEASDKISEKLRNIGQQLEDIQQSRSQLQTTVACIETTQESAPDIDLIKSQQALKECIQKAEDDFNTLDLVPCEVADVGVEVSDADDHGKVWRDHSYTFHLADPKKCTVTGSSLSYLETDNRGILEVNILDAYGKPCTGHQSLNIDLHRVRDKIAGKAQVTNRGAGLYEIAVLVASRGRYKLSIEINGSHVAESPYNIFVAKPPQQISAPLKTIDHLKSPSGLSCSNNKLIISNHDHDFLTIISSDGERSQMKLPAPLPTGATYDQDGNLYVCTAQNCKLYKFNKTGQQLKSTMTGQFKFPNGMVLSQQNQLYVCDSNDDRIRVFDTELIYQYSIPTKSLRSGTGSMPLDIDIDSDGRLYLVEHKNQRIEVLDSNGGHLLTIGARRSGSLLQSASFSLLASQAKLTKPAGVKVFRNHVYVADWEGNCVFVFTKEGNLVTVFGGDILKHPEGLTVDEDGYIYVAHSRKEVVIF